MTASIDPDRLHAAWQALDRQMQRHDVQLLQHARTSSMLALQRRLRPLRWGQVTQMLLGLGLVLLAVPVWTGHRDVAHVFASGLIVHGYGVATMLLGGLTLGALSRLRYDDPVIALQKRVVTLQSHYIAGSSALGLAWWLMWIPFAAVAFAWLGVDFLARVAPALPWMIGGGLGGLAATAAFHRWARRRPALHARLRRNMAGASLTAATAELAALRDLERDD